LREYDYRNWRRRVFQTAASAAALDIRRPYDLCHAFASLLLHEGRSLVYWPSNSATVATLSGDYAHIIAELRHQPPLARRRGDHAGAAGEWREDRLALPAPRRKCSTRPRRPPLTPLTPVRGPLDWT
jgi:hypothetical protein